MKVKAVFINKPGEVETRWVDYPHKKENEVLIKQAPPHGMTAMRCYSSTKLAADNLSHIA